MLSSCPRTKASPPGLAVRNAAYRYDTAAMPQAHRFAGALRPSLVKRCELLKGLTGPLPVAGAGGWASTIALRERDGDVAVVVGDTRPGDGPGREIGEAQAEVAGLEGMTLILDALLPRPSLQ